MDLDGILLPYLALWVFAFCVVALALPPTRWRNVLVVPIAVYLGLQARRTPRALYAIEYPRDSGVYIMLFGLFDRIVRATPDKEGWVPISEEKDENGRPKQNRVPQSFLGRLWWSFRVQCAPRGYKWTYQIKQIPPAPPRGYSRWLWRFVAIQLLRFAVYFVFSETAKVFVVLSPYGKIVGQQKQIVGWGQESLWKQMLLGWSMAAQSWWNMKMIEAFLLGTTVALGIWEPNDCPPVFGELKKMYSVRKVWSEVWHQYIRYVTSAIGIFLARDVFRFRKGTFLSKYTQLYAAFFISGLGHALSAGITAGSVVTQADMRFFMLQPVAIMVEDLVKDWGRKLGFRDNAFWRILGYIWTIAWFSYTFKDWVNFHVTLGLYEQEKPVDLFGLIDRYGE